MHRLPSLLIDRGMAGTVARRLVPAAIVVPIIMGTLRFYSDRSGLLSSPMANALYIAISMLLLLTVVSWVARLVALSDQARAESLAQEKIARQAAETANMAKNNFLTVMSHELRTPLSAVIGYEEILADGIAGPVTDLQRYQLGRIKLSAQHLLRLIDQILDYSRVDLIQTNICSQTAMANALMDEAVSLIDAVARDNGLQVVVTHLPMDLQLRTDPVKVRQVLVNLLSNAVKFTPRGEVTISAQRVTHNGSDAVAFRVQDTGIGIAPEHLDNIFEEFWQVEQPTTRRTGGTGLGLSFTRRLVHLLGGTITVDSTLGLGSTFTVTLPTGTSLNT
jgi:signal transduction histidine kinase